MKVLLASDHAGFNLKEFIKKILLKNGNKVLDLYPKKLRKIKKILEF